MKKDFVIWNLCKKCEFNCVKYVGYNTIMNGIQVYVKEKSGNLEKCRRMAGNKRSKNRPVSEANRQALIKRNKERVWTKEMRTKVSDSVSDYYANNPNPMQGKKHTLEAKEKITKRNLSRKTGKGKQHYAFKGSSVISNPTGLSHHRLREELLAKYIKNNGMYCEYCGNLFHNKKLDDTDKVVMHHCVNTREVIDVIQDVNKEWNVYFIHKSCHSKIHNKLRNKLLPVNIPNWNKYVKKHKLAILKMAKLIAKEQQRES